MAEHKWEIQAAWEDWWIECNCGAISHRMGWSEIERRLNATEELSAEDARLILRLHAANENDDMWILNYYAEALDE